MSCFKRKPLGIESTGRCCHGYTCRARVPEPMNDKEYRRIVRVAQAAHKKWRAILGISDWAGRLHYVRGSMDGDTSMRCKPNYAYKWYNITIFAEYAANYYGVDDEKIERDMLHELVHVLLVDSQDAIEGAYKSRPARRLVERMTTEVADALWWAHEAGEQAARSAARKNTGKKVGS